MDSSENHRLAKLWRELTQRQMQVMQRLAAGMRCSRIASELGVSEITVQAYRRDGMKRLGAATSADLARIVVEIGVAPDTGGGISMRHVV
jgi:FixJ family two-component response regulator